MRWIQYLNIQSFYLTPNKTKTTREFFFKEIERMFTFITQWPSEMVSWLVPLRSGKDVESKRSLVPDILAGRPEIRVCDQRCAKSDSHVPFGAEIVIVICQAKRTFKVDGIPVLWRIRRPLAPGRTLFRSDPHLTINKFPNVRVDRFATGVKGIA